MIDLQLSILFMPLHFKIQQSERNFFFNKVYFCICSKLWLVKLFPDHNSQEIYSADVISWKNIKPHVADDECFTVAISILIITSQIFCEEDLVDVPCYHRWTCTVRISLLLATSLEKKTGCWEDKVLKKKDSQNVDD